MKAVIGILPAGDGWWFELKWDGVRLGARIHDGEVQLRSISGRTVTSTYPELAALGPAVGIDAELDGEAVVFDNGRPSFGRLQHRMHVVAPSGPLVAEYPVVYVVFDLLALDGRSLVELPYVERRRLLTELIDDGPNWRVPPAVDGDGRPLLDLADQRGLEGIVAKRGDAPYVPGTRSPHWIKVKVRRRQEFVVVGWLGGQGNLEGQIGSVLLAVNDDDGELVYCGAAGSGLSEQDRRLLGPSLVELDHCPLAFVPLLDRPPHWVVPSVVVDVEYGSWPDGGVLRHPVVLGIRSDRVPSDVVRELPPD